MSLNALLHLWYAQHVSGTSMPIIRSSRLYECYYRLWCAVLGCWLSGVRCRQQDVSPGRGMLHDSPKIQCPKHVERIISAIKHSVTSSWVFFSTHVQRCTDKHTWRFSDACGTQLPNYVASYSRRSQTLTVRLLQ